jgi:carboxyvinyl-carboxyphosphonate phosphorylmutase
MTATERRERVRAVLAGDACVRPASVFDPISGRLAEAAGLGIGMLGGSVAAAVVLGAPDVGVITLSELAGQVRRISRACEVALLVDADNGYGNALNAMRTVRELEDAGAAGFTLEDTALPPRYGAKGEELIATTEMVDKLRAGVAARRDPATVILGRTHALNHEGIEATAARVAAYAATGVDGIFLMGIRTEEQLAAMRAATDLPFMLGTTPAALTNELLATYGVRLVLRGHSSFGASVAAVQTVMARQAAGEPDDPAAQPPAEVLGIATATPEHAAWRRAFGGG